MTKKQLIERRALLEADLEQYLAYANQVRGAIEDINYWLSLEEGADNAAPDELGETVKGNE